MTLNADLYAQAHARTHSDCSRNWLFILVGVEILWEEEDPLKHPSEGKLYVFYPKLSLDYFDEENFVPSTILTIALNHVHN